MESDLSSLLMIEFLQESSEVGADVDSLMGETRRLLLLGTLHKESGRSREELNVLTQARDNQVLLLIS